MATMAPVDTATGCTAVTQKLMLHSCYNNMQFKGGYYFFKLFDICHTMGQNGQLLKINDQILKY